LNWIDECIGVGDIIDAYEVDDLRKQGVDFIVDARTLFETVKVEFLDENRPVPGKILKATKLLVALSDLDAKILIHCLVGIDRTPFLAMVYVSKKYKMSYETAYKFVSEKRPNTRYHWDWVELLESSETDSAALKK
jgi:dual specificity MAP kinase phosphatase